LDIAVSNPQMNETSVRIMEFANPKRGYISVMLCGADVLMITICDRRQASFHSSGNAGHEGLRVQPLVTRSTGKT
jgi:hypothetical protein